MPNLDLRDHLDRSRLKPLAHFELMAVMLAPDDKSVRERTMDCLKRETGQSKPRHVVLSDLQIDAVIGGGSTRGAAAGFTMTTLSQMGLLGHDPTFNSAIKLIQHLLLTEERDGQHWNAIPKKWNLHPLEWQNRLKRSPRKLREIYLQFGPIAHLWAAYLFGQQQVMWLYETNKESCPAHLPKEEILSLIDRAYGITPESLEQLPRFLGYANAFRRAYYGVRFRNDRLWHISHPWTVTLPEGMEVQQSIQVLPIPPEVLNAFTR